MENKIVILKDNEVLIFSVGKEFNYAFIVISGKKFKIKIANKNKNNLVDEYRIVVKDMNTYEQKSTNELVNANATFDIYGDRKATIKFCDSLTRQINTIKNSSFKSIYTDREDFYIFNGGFIFIGCFLGLLFTMGTVLIICYKMRIVKDLK